MDTITVRQSWWKQAGLVLLSLLFVAMGVVLVLDREYLIGVACVLVFGACAIAILSRPRVLLIADHEGLTYMKRRSSVKIPWPMVERVAVATQIVPAGRLRLTNTYHYLAVYLRDKDFLTSGLTGAAAWGEAGMEMFKASGLSGMDDGGTAQIYIPAVAIAGSAQKISEELNAMRPSASL